MTAAPAVPLMACDLTIPDRQHLATYIRANARHVTRVVGEGTHAGRTLLLCGAGPSLADAWNQLPATDDVWACNSALPYLWDRGHRVTHGFAVDQGEAMLAAGEFGRALPVEYLLASSVNPALVRLLLRRHRRITWFHNYLGQPDPPGWVPTEPGESHELHLYRTLFPSMPQVGYGLNSVQRAAALAQFMGYAHVTVVGADCACAPDGPPMPPSDSPAYAAWLDGLRFYADGRTAAVYGPDAWMVEGLIDGRRWHTRGDMVISAVHMAEMARAAGDRMTLLGDTLPAALLPHLDDPEFMERLPTMAGAGRVVNIGAGRRPVEA